MPKYQLPPGLGRTGDPVSGNPFPPHDPRHRVWAEATLEAEEDVARARATTLSFATRVSPSAWVDVFLANIDLTRFEFDTWAMRGIKVIWSDGAMRSYDEWLVLYANALIKGFEGMESLASAPSAVPTESILTRLRSSLGARVNYWKAEVRRHRADQKRRISRRSASSTPPETVPPEVISARMRLVKNYRRRNDLTFEELAKRLHMSEGTLRNVMNGDKKRGFAPERQEALLEILEVSNDEWYGVSSPE